MEELLIKRERKKNINKWLGQNTKQNLSVLPKDRFIEIKDFLYEVNFDAM